MKLRQQAGGVAYAAPRFQFPLPERSHMTETILVIIAVAAALAIAARRMTAPGSNFPEPLDSAAELPEPVPSDKSDRE